MSGWANSSTTAAPPTAPITVAMSDSPTAFSLRRTVRYVIHPITIPKTIAPAFAIAVSSSACPWSATHGLVESGPLDVQAREAVGRVREAERVEPGEQVQADLPQHV